MRLLLPHTATSLSRGNIRNSSLLRIKVHINLRLPNHMTKATDLLQREVSNTVKISTTVGAILHNNNNNSSSRRTNKAASILPNNNSSHTNKAASIPARRLRTNIRNRAPTPQMALLNNKDSARPIQTLRLKAIEACSELSAEEQQDMWVERRWEATPY